MMLIDTVASKNMTGKAVETVLDAVGITLNKNMIPDDPRSPFDPSGVRLGVAAVTTRGMKTKEMRAIARIINDACDAHADAKTLSALRRDVQKLCKAFPLNT